MKKIIIIITIVSLMGCLKEDRFPFSDKSAITNFTIAGQSSATTINNDSLVIVVPFPGGTDVTDLTPSGVTINNLATISPDTTSAQDFSNPFTYKVTAEDGTFSNWKVKVVPQEGNQQLQNSDFNTWYDAGGYEQPGEDANSTIWGTANRPLASFGSNNTLPVQTNGDDYYVNMITVPAPALVRIAAATIFTGVFTDAAIPSVTDPRSNITFGTPYAGVPVSFSTDYQYTPGSSFEDDNGNVLPGNDSCDIYVLLQLVDQNDPTNIQRVATAWFRNGETVTDWTTVTTDFIYGELPPGYPGYMQPIAPEIWAPAGTVANQITVVYSSSAFGDSFTGAVGSELNADNFVLNY